MCLRRAPVAALLLFMGSPGWTAENATPAVKSFELTASRFQYDPDTIEVQEGDQVKITLRSADTTHGFAIKQFNVKTKVPKGGEPVTVEFVADKAGTYDFICSEYCGPGHRDMKGKLVVTPRAQ